MHEGKLLSIIDRKWKHYVVKTFALNFYCCSFIVRTNTLLTEIIGSSGTTSRQEAEIAQTESYEDDDLGTRVFDSLVPRLRMCRPPIGPNKGTPQCESEVCKVVLIGKVKKCDRKYCEIIVELTRL
jgi:hypothetical protein